MSFLENKTRIFLRRKGRRWSESQCKITTVSFSGYPYYKYGWKIQKISPLFQKVEDLIWYSHMKLKFRSPSYRLEEVSPHVPTQNWQGARERESRRLQFPNPIEVNICEWVKCNSVSTLRPLQPVLLFQLKIFANTKKFMKIFSLSFPIACSMSLSSNTPVRQPLFLCWRFYNADHWLVWE